MKDEHVSLPKSKSQLAQLHDDDDEDVIATSVIDRNAARPLALQNTCLAEFAVMYDVIQSSTNTEETEDVNTEEEMQNIENVNPCHHHQVSSALSRLNVMDLHFSLFSAFLIHSL